MGCPFGPSLCGAANMVVLGAAVVPAPELVSNVGTGDAGLVAGAGIVIGARGVITAGAAGVPSTAGAGVPSAAGAGIVTVVGANGAANGSGETIDGVAGGAGAPKTDGAAFGAGVMTTGARGACGDTVTVLGVSGAATAAGAGAGGVMPRLALAGSGTPRIIV